MKLYLATVTAIFAADPENLEVKASIATGALNDEISNEIIYSEIKSVEDIPEEWKHGVYYGYNPKSNRVEDFFTQVRDEELKEAKQEYLKAKKQFKIAKEKYSNLKLLK